MASEADIQVANHTTRNSDATQTTRRHSPDGFLGVEEANRIITVADTIIRTTNIMQRSQAFSFSRKVL